MIHASDSNASAARAGRPARPRSASSESSPFCSVGSRRSKRSTAAASSVRPGAARPARPRRPSLSSLSKAMKNPACGVLGEAAVPGDQAEDPPIVDPHGQVREAQPRQRLARWPGSARPRPRRSACPSDVDVALGELPEPPLLRPLGPPHRPDLDRLERIGQLGVVLRVVARQRHGEVEAQPEVGELVARPLGALEIFARA